MDSVKPACFIPWVIPNEVDTYLASQENNCVTMFAVVHFVEDNTVEVVPMLWLVKSGNKDYCYWPPRNQTEKAKKACIPDKEKWDIHPVRILCNAETYSRGKTLSRRAEVTSHLESEEEEEGRRNRKRNRKYASSGDDRGKKRHYQDSENDDEETDDEHIQSCRQQVAPKPAELPSPPPALPPILLPLPPTLPPLPPTLPPPPPTLPPHPPTLPPHPPTFQLSIRPSSPVPTYEEFEVMEVNQDTGMPHIIRKSRSNTPVIPTRRMSFEQKVDQMIEGVIAASPEPTSHCHSERSHSMSNLQVLETPSSSRSQRVMTSPEPTARSVSQIETPSNSGQGAVLTSMLRRIMGIEKTLQEHSSMLTRVLDVLDVQEDAGPLLEEAVATVEELMELDEKLQNKDFAKKMVNYLSSLGGGDPGDTTRRMMRKVANNFVWSHFSVHGQKGKKKLSNLRIFEVIKGAYRRKYKGAGSDKEAEANIGHTLKHAPHRPGGVKIRPQQNVTAVNDDNEEPRT